MLPPPLEIAWIEKPNNETPVDPNRAYIAEYTTAAASPDPGDGSTPAPATDGDTTLVKNLDRFGSPSADVAPEDQYSEAPTETPETGAENQESDVAKPEMPDPSKTPDVPPTALTTAADPSDGVQPVKDPAKAALSSLLDEIEVAANQNSEKTSQPNESKPAKLAEAGDNPDSASRTLFRYDMEFSSDRLGDPAFDALANPVAAYLRDFRRRLETEWYNRMNAIDRFAWPQGELIVQITIAKQGEIKDVNVLKTTGSIPTKYINATLESIEPQRQYKPFTGAMSGESITLTIRYSF